MPEDWEAMEQRSQERLKRQREEKQRQKDLADDEKHLSDTVHREINTLMKEGVDKPVQYTHRQGAMDIPEINASLSEGITDIEEQLKEVGHVYGEITELKSRIQDLVEGIPGSSAAEEAYGIAEAASGTADKLTTELEAVKGKLEELQSYFGNIA